MISITINSVSVLSFVTISKFFFSNKKEKKEKEKGVYPNSFSVAKAKIIIKRIARLRNAVSKRFSEEKGEFRPAAKNKILGGIYRSSEEVDSNGITSRQR